MPWKNGGGTTRDVASFPPGAGIGDFGWRLSIADVDVAGPFSHFPGVDRSLSLLSGQLELVIAGRPVVLAPEDGACVFPGDVDVVGTPLTDGVRDLNLMVRRGVWEGEVTRLTDFPVEIAGEGVATMIVVPLGHAVVRIDQDPQGHWLDPLDALRIETPGMVGIDADGPVLLVKLRRED